MPFLSRVCQTPSLPLCNCSSRFPHGAHLSKHLLDQGQCSCKFSSASTYFSWWPSLSKSEHQDVLSETDDTARRSPLPTQPPPSQQRTSRRIYILGLGNVGNFVAHSLAGIPNRPPITLLLHREALLTKWKRVHGRIEVITHGISEYRSGFDVELNGSRSESYSASISAPGDSNHDDTGLYRNSTNDTSLLSERASDDSNAFHIGSLIVAVPAHQTLAALRLYKHRLSQYSTIFFLQNGMGILDQLNEELFPHLESRPNYILGINTHGLYGNRPFSVKHPGIGTMAVGLVPNYPIQHIQDADDKFLHGQLTEQTPTSARYLLRTVTRTPGLVATGFSTADLIQLQLEKLAVNCIINPMTTILDCKNGALLHNSSFTRIMRLLLAEISLVIRSLPELKNLPNTNIRFSPERLETLVVSIASQTSENTSSMLQCVKRRQKTEIDYINGYIIGRGEELGIKCMMNYMTMHLVNGKLWQLQKEEMKKIPTT